MIFLYLTGSSVYVDTQNMTTIHSFEYFCSTNEAIYIEPPTKTTDRYLVHTDASTRRHGAREFQ